MRTLFASGGARRTGIANRARPGRAEVVLRLLHIVAP